MALDAGRIQKTVRKLRKLLKTVPRRPSPDEIHDLRTHIRRLEAALEALALNSKRNERRVPRGLGRLRRRAGKIQNATGMPRNCMHRSENIVRHFGAD